MFLSVWLEVQSVGTSGKLGLMERAGRWFNAYHSPREGYWFNFGASANTDGTTAAATRRRI